MSNINASVINQSRERGIPRPEDFNPESKNQDHKPTLDNQDHLNQSKPPKMKATSIGNYILGKTLGEGTFGKVKLATHILTGEKVAIKILEKDRIIDVADVERVAREIYILKFIRHPNIIQLYEIIETPKQLFLVMEFVTGGELFDYIVSKTRVDEKEASKLFHQIIAGIEYIHKLKIVHRDLKPENLLLDYNKNIKIVDFGLSNTYNENELLKTACGSPCYAAPEMIGGKKYNGLQVDIWSCGVILFAIICGYLPFEDANTAVLYKKILGGDYTIPDFISEDGRDLLQNILNIDPAKRYTIQDIRKHPWMNQMDVTRKCDGIVVGYHQNPVDHDVLKQLEQYGFQYDNAQKCLDANKHNHVTTTYYLLLRKFHQNGGQSTADINSENFDKSLLLPKTAQPKVSNYASVNYENEGEKENERRVERNRSRNRSIDQNQSFAYGEMTIKQRQSKEIAKIYGSIIDSGSRDRLPTSNPSAKVSRVLKENNFLENNNNPNEFRRRSFNHGKKGFSPARNDSKENRSSKAGENKEPFTPSNTQGRTSDNWFFNKTFNQNLRKKLKEISRVGGEKPTKPRHARGESFDGSFTGIQQSFNYDLLNDSSKLDIKDTNSTMISSMQPKLFDYSTKNANKKQTFTSSIQPSPKKEPRGSYHHDERLSSNISDINKATRNLKVITSVNNYHDKSRTTSQSPSKVNPALPREPSYAKPRDSSTNPYKKVLHMRKNSCRPGIQLNNGKAWRPSSNHSLIRERGKSIGGMDDSFKGQSTHDTSVNIGNSSFMLNSSFQKKVNDQSFEYYSQNPRGYLNQSNKRISYGGENANKRGRNVNYSPVNINKKNL